MEITLFEYSNPLGLILILAGIVFFIAGWVQQKFPPKKVNHLYGYRTKSSMRNQDVWKFAQEYSSDKMRKYSLYMILLGVLFSFFELEGIGSLWLGLVLTILVPVIMMIEVERELKKRFPKE
ncbi:MAG: SdpI family protein [Flavobacteriaceae bacterium]